MMFLAFGAKWGIPPPDAEASAAKSLSSSRELRARAPDAGAALLEEPASGGEEG